MSYLYILGTDHFCSDLKYKFYDFEDEYYIYHMNHHMSGVISVKDELFESLNNKKIPYLTSENF